MENSNFNPITKSIEEWEETFQKGYTLWVKPLILNYKGVDSVYEDFFKLNSKRDFKVSEITIYYHNLGVVKGIKFTYQNLLNPIKIVEGYEMLKVPKNSDLKKVTLNLDIDEYIVGIFGRKYACFHSLGFVTSKSKIVETREAFAGNKFSINAPDKKHFNIFSGSIGDNKESLTNLACEVESLPGDDIIHYNYNFFKQKAMLSSLIDFLPHSELMNLFFVNKELSGFRINPYFIGNIWFRYIYSCSNQLRKYTKNMLKKIIDTELAGISPFIDLLKVSKNKIMNAYGKSGFDGWSHNWNWSTSNKGVQTGRQTCFASSHDSRGVLKFQKNAENLFTKAEIDDFNNGTVFFVVGTNVSAPNFNVEAKFSFEIERNGEKIYSKSVHLKDDELNQSYRHLSFKLFNMSISENDIFIIEINGKDKKYWKGYFGPTFSGTYIRVLPTNKNFEKYHLGLVH